MPGRHIYGILYIDRRGSTEAGRHTGRVNHTVSIVISIKSASFFNRVSLTTVSLCVCVWLIMTIVSIYV